MKLKTIYKLLLITFVAIFTISCNDTLDQVGFSIQPDKDRLTVGIDTLQLQARTVQVDSIFGKTSFPVLGEYADPVFGSIKSEYIAEFYLPKGMEFKEGAVIDSVRVEIAYTSMVGDTIAPMTLSVYEVVKSLSSTNDYTNVNPELFADMSAPLGEQSFTGRNSTNRIKSYTAQDYSTVTYTEYFINVEVPKTIGDKFLEEFKKAGHGKLSDTDTFREFFPGLYFTTSFGNSTIISADLTSLFVHYHYLDEKGSSTKQDTIRTDVFKLNNTPEVRQVNHIKSSNDELLVDNPDVTYIKSPAGVNTEIKFPISEVHENLQSMALNLVNFTVYALPYESENKMVKLSPPDYLLLINKDSLDGFFENRKLRDNVTSFLSEKFDPSTYSYKFNNISSMINYYNRENNDEPYDLVYYLIPVEATYTSVQQGYSSQQMLTKIQNLMWPSATILDKRQGSLQLELIFSKL
ncbi:MAG: DUF4270 domain-containing protein [Fermentimonas sp.]|nr:DUF4270 domain-containing protein [Fermentimonas sp.]